MQKNEIILRRQRMNGFRLSLFFLFLSTVPFFAGGNSKLIRKGGNGGGGGGGWSQSLFFWLPLFSQTCISTLESDAAKNQNSTSSEPEATGDSIRPFLRAKIASHGVWFSIPRRILRARVWNLGFVNFRSCYEMRRKPSFKLLNWFVWINGKMAWLLLQAFLFGCVHQYTNV